MTRFSFVVAFIAGIGPTSPAAEREPLVSLDISKVAAERIGPYIVVSCRAVIDNATGRDLTVRSMFYSAFDGLEIVVTTREGKLLEQRGYTEDQSPFKFKGRDFPLKQGKAVKELAFSLSHLPEGLHSLRVRLVGTLPGSSYKRILSSETLAVDIKGR